jgi:hypothetical protein
LAFARALFFEAGRCSDFEEGRYADAIKTHIVLMHESEQAERYYIKQETVRD